MKKIIHILAIWALSLVTISAMAQKEDALIRSGNRLYQQKQLDQAKQQYQKAAAIAPQNPVVQYNLGNAQFRKDEYEDAVKSYAETIDRSKEIPVKEKGMYNKGVAEIKQKKLEESISSWKDALRLDPADEDARINLQKALQELKSKQPPPPQQDKKDQKKEQKPQQSKLSKQQVEQLLKALEQKEKDVQDKMNQNKVKSLSHPEKDW